MCICPRPTCSGLSNGLLSKCLSRFERLTPLPRQSGGTLTGGTMSGGTIPGGTFTDGTMPGDTTPGGTILGLASPRLVLLLLGLGLSPESSL